MSGNSLQYLRDLQLAITAKELSLKYFESSERVLWLKTTLSSSFHSASSQSFIYLDRLKKNKKTTTLNTAAKTFVFFLIKREQSMLKSSPTNHLSSP